MKYKPNYEVKNCITTNPYGDRKTRTRRIWRATCLPATCRKCKRTNEGLLRDAVGDHIYLFGFTGALAIRSLAGFVDRIGLLLARYAHDEMVLQRAYSIYADGNTKNKQLALIREAMNSNAGVTPLV
jgi:hypothetical protein